MNTYSRVFQTGFYGQETDFSLSEDLRYLLFFAAAVVLLHLPFLARYGIHRDELYAYSCSLRPGFGYLDHALITPWMTALSQALFGKSLMALRLFPLLGGAAVVILTGLMARGFGGRRFAMTVVSVCVLLSPYFVFTRHYMSQASFEPLFWTASSLILLHILKTGPGPWWLMFGVTAGCGLITRPSMLVYGVGVTATLLLTPYRRHLADKWFWLGGVAAFLILLPNLVWQMQHGWATVTFLIESRDHITVPPVSEFLYGQALFLEPLRAAVCAAGFIWLMAGREKHYRVFGWIYLVTLFLMSVMKSKIYYILPVYPVLFAAGGAALERWLMPGRRRMLVAASLLVSGLVVLPTTLPVLPLKHVDAYTSAVTFGLLDGARYTGFHHDEVGWDKHAESLKTIYQALPQEMQKKCCFLAGNYGPAGAIEYFLDFPGRPPVASKHLSWHLWGPPDDHYDIALAISNSRFWLEEMFEEVLLIGFTEQVPLALDKSFAVWLCLKPKGPYREIWPDKVSYEWW